MLARLCLLALLTGTGLRAHAESLLYAVAAPWKVLPTAAITEIHAHDPVSLDKRTVYSDRHRPITLRVDANPDHPLVAVAGAGRLYACVHDRRWAGGGCRNDPNRPVQSTIHEITLDGTNQTRRVFVPQGDQFVTRLALNPAGTFIAYVNAENSVSPGPGQKMTYSIFAHRTSDGTPIQRINLSSLCMDCYVGWLGWLDDRHLVFTFDTGDEHVMQSPDSMKKTGIYQVAIDGSGLERLRDSLLVELTESPERLEAGFIHQIHPWAGSDPLLLVASGWNNQRNRRSVLFRADIRLRTRGRLPLDTGDGADDLRPSPGGKWVAVRRSLTERTARPPWRFHTELWAMEIAGSSKTRVDATEPSNDPSRIILLGWRP